MGRNDGTVGVVKTKYFDFPELRLESGKRLTNVRIAYETYGSLNREKTNAILLCHALSGDAHAAGKHRKDSKRRGWYDVAVGPGKSFDTRKYFIISSNVIGGCRGSTGPSSINPRTKKPYALDFPQITISDMVAAQKRLVDHLGIRKLFAVAGGSMGGMQVLEWALRYPDSVQLALAIATAARQHPQGIAFNYIGRKAITDDPDWRCGNYYGRGAPVRGLSLARQIGHVTYLSPETLERKFSRIRSGKGNGRKFGKEFEVHNYFDYQGKSFVRRFDANSYLYITHAIDHFDLTNGGRRKLSDALRHAKAKFLLVSFTSDWLYPPAQVEEIYSGLAEAGVPVVYRKLDLPYGHDAFLVYNNTLGNVLVNFLEDEGKKHRITSR